MEHPDLEARQVALEMQFSFLEEHVGQQDREILRLRDQVQRLQEEIIRLRDAQEGGGMPLQEGERPPHY